MGFFALFWDWLNGQLGAYIGDNTARVASALEPALVTLGTLYVVMWGYLQLSGRMEEPFSQGIKRIATLAVVLGVALRLWLYNTLLVDTFYQAPAELAAAVIGSPDTIGTLDSIWERGGSVADVLWNNGGWSFDFGYKIAGLLIWLVVALLCVYTMFLIALSHVALAILLALGPLFIPMLLFESTRRLFDAWLLQLANYALVTVLTVMAAALLLQIVESYVNQTAALGSTVQTVDALNMMLVTVLVFLFMRQVMPIAATLASGATLSTFGTVSRAVNWGARLGTSAVGRGARITAALLRGGR